MNLTEGVDLSASTSDVWPHVAELDRYPNWLRLVHRAAPEPGAPRDAPAWDVELRASVGPFARSKVLRMVRTAVDSERLARFERLETDGRQHANWTLVAELAPVEFGTRLTMHLSYDGRLWSGGLMARVLQDEIERGRRNLAALVAT